MAFRPTGTEKALNVSFQSILNWLPVTGIKTLTDSPSLSHAPSLNFYYLMLAAQKIIQAERGHFIKVTGVKQVADSLVISQT